MPFTPDTPFPKSRGDSLRSKDWNDAVRELIRVDAAKVNRAGGDTLAGPLTIDGPLTVTGAVATRRTVLTMGTTDGSAASADAVVGAVGFMAGGVAHGQLAYRAGRGFELVDHSDSAPRL